MAMSKKDKTQLAILGAIIGVVLIVVIVKNQDKFLPEPAGGGEDFSAPARLGTPVNIDSEFFSRPDFAGLRHYGEINIIPPDTVDSNKKTTTPVDGEEITLPIDNTVEDTP